MSRGYVRYTDEFGDPVTLRDVVDLDEIGEPEGDDPIEVEPLVLDCWKPDPWTHDAVIAALILAFQDADQSVVAPW